MSICVENKKTNNLSVNDIDMENIDIEPTTNELLEIETNEITDIINDTTNDDTNTTNDTTDDTNSINILNVYLDSIGKYKLLSADEEVELFKRLKNGDESAKTALINSNLKLVYSVVKRYYNGYFQYNSSQILDLIQDGNLGLMKAIDKFDYTIGCKFSTYAFYWIKQYMLRSLQTNGSNIRIPARISDQVRLFNKARMHMPNSASNCNPTLKQLSDFINTHPEYKECSIKTMTPKIINNYETLYNLTKTVSLSTPVSDDEETTLADFIAADDNNCPDKISDSILQTDYLINIIDSVLDEKSALVIKLRFGLGTKQDIPMSLQDIAYLLNSSRERIRQVERNSLLKLKTYLETMCRKTGTSYKDLF